MTATVVAVAPAQSISTGVLTTPLPTVATPVAPSIQTQSLPPECGSIKLGTTHSVIICKPIPDSIGDKLIVTVPSIAISLIALSVSYFAFRYNKNKDSTARDLSIQDDYWLRKIVSPSSIEPFEKFCTEVISELPEISLTKVITYDEVKAWHTAHHKTLLRLKPSFKSLELLDIELLGKVENELTSFEDELAIYVGNVGVCLNAGGKAPVRAVAATKLMTIKLNLLRHIQTHQKSLGKKTLNGSSKK
jgi:hypothetical protein